MNKKYISVSQFGDWGVSSISHVFYIGDVSKKTFNEIVKEIEEFSKTNTSLTKLLEFIESKQFYPVILSRNIQHSND